MPSFDSQDDPFTELFALVRPERLLQHPQANGEGVSVCVVDSGVERRILEQRAAERGQELKPIQGGIFVENRPDPLPYDGRQSTPHGTTVADIILTIAPRVQLYSADVFGVRGACEIETVINAIRWAVRQWQCKIINLSLGVTEQRLAQLPRRHELLRAVEEAYFNDVLVFAAAHNEHPLVKSYPAVFAPPLISVDKRVFRQPLEFAYRLVEQVEFQAHSIGYVGPFSQEPATSWAAPHLAGIAARLLSLRPSLKPFEVKTLLYWMSQRGSDKARGPRD